MSSPSAYQALLLMSFGGPEGPDDVMPFLRNVTRGRNVPDERLTVVAEHYFHFGGRSPINDLNRALLAALKEATELPVYWGNRNWDPYLTDTVTQMRDDGITHAIAFATSAYSSYSSCRQYHDDIDRARAEVGADAPVIDKVRPYWNHPGFVTANAEHLAAALADAPADARVVFTAHSIPHAMAATGDYEVQLRDLAQILMDRVGGGRQWDLAYQSRSGPPQVPWLEPDIGDHLRTIVAEGVGHTVVAPIGFVSDHMEVVWDLDVEAAEIAAELSVGFTRVPTAGTHPAFVQMVVDLIAEHDGSATPVAIGQLGPRVSPCVAGCCAYTPGRPPGR